MLTRAKCRGENPRFLARACDLEVDTANAANGVTRTYYFMTCGDRSSGDVGCSKYPFVGAVPSVQTGIVSVAANRTIAAPYMCLQLEPSDRAQNTQCTCWPRGSAALATRTFTSTPLPRDACNPEGVYARYDAATVTPATQKCCPGLRFGCLDNLNGTSCRDPATETNNGGRVIIYKYCFDPRKPNWEVTLPRLGAY